MNKDAYYFTHDANAQDDPKCMILIDQLGMEGYGIFWALVEKLRSEKEYRLPLSVATSFAKRWGTSREKVLAVISNYGLFVVEDDEFFYSNRLRYNMLKKSEAARKSVGYRWDRDTNVIRTNNERNTNDIRSDTTDIRRDTIKVKYSKVNTEKKVLRTKKNPEEEQLDKLTDSEKSEWEKFKTWAAKKASKLSQMKWPLKPKELFTLRKDFPADVLIEVMLAMENHSRLMKKYDSAYLTIRSWAKIRLKDRAEKNTGPEPNLEARLKNLN